MLENIVNSVISQQQIQLPDSQWSWRNRDESFINTEWKLRHQDFGCHIEKLINPRYKYKPLVHNILSSIGKDWKKPNPPWGDQRWAKGTQRRHLLVLYFGSWRYSLWYACSRVVEMGLNVNNRTCGCGYKSKCKMIFLILFYFTKKMRRKWPAHGKHQLKWTRYAYTLWVVFVDSTLLLHA